MSELPIISVVTPTLNQGRFIKDTIESVLSQKYPRLEYLVIDGGSTDGTREILVNYGDAITWRSEPGLSQTEAINLGWGQMGGEIFSWINSDDIYYPGTFKKVGNLLTERPEVDMVYGDCDYIDEHGEYLRPYPTREYNYLELLQETENYIPQPATFLRRKILENIGYLDKELEYVMDFDFWLKAGRWHKVMYFPEKMAAMRLQWEAKSIAKLSEFAKELVIIYQAYFSDEDLPSALRSVEREAMAGIYHRAADCAFWGNDYTLAREMLVKSLKYSKWPPRKLWLWVLSGKIGGLLAKVTKKNPYFP